MSPSIRPSRKGSGSSFTSTSSWSCTLLAYFPFSKLMHMAGVFLSPTRNLSNDSRIVRHVNPWNYPVKVHTYEEYEDEFRDKMIEAGLPVEKRKKARKRTTRLPETNEIKESLWPSYRNRRSAANSDHNPPIMRGG